jgi:hypothetical protein
LSIFLFCPGAAIDDLHPAFEKIFPILFRKLIPFRTAGEIFLRCANFNRLFPHGIFGRIKFSPIKSGLFTRSTTVKFHLALPLLNAPERRCGLVQTRRGLITLTKNYEEN